MAREPFRPFGAPRPPKTFGPLDPDTSDLIGPPVVAAYLPLLEEVVFQCDTEGRLTALSQQWEYLVGCTSESSIGTFFVQYVRDDYVPSIRSMITQRLGRMDQIPLRHASGEERWATFSVQPLENGDLVGVLSDITLERSIQEELAMLSMVANATTNLVVVTDGEGAIQWVNTAFERVTGFRLADVRGTGLLERLSGPDTDPETVVAVHHALEQRVAVKGDILQYTKFGAPLWLEYSLAPVFDRHGHIDRFISVNIDTTERRNHELAMREQQAELESRVHRRTAQLAAAKELAEQATSAKSAFVSTMSHEIRTPLNAIVGFTALLLSTELTEQQRTYAEKTERSIEILLGLVNDVLDFSKIEAGAMTLATEPFDLRAIFESVDAVSGSSARSKGLDFSITLDEGVPAIVVGDRLRLSEVLLNLVSNAVKFTQVGGIEVRLVVDYGTPEVITLRCSVTDTGIGIAPSELPTLFEAFTQADSSTTRHFGGTGLGLAISKRLVELMGGTLAVESALGHGSTFSFTVNVGVSGVTDVMERASSSNPRSLGHLRGARILVAEDNPFNQDVVVDLLAARGAIPVAVDNGIRVLSALAGPAVFDLVLMDVQMPEMDGIVATREIRLQPRFAHLPIIGLTANTMASDRAMCVEAGMNEVLSKPYTPDVLYDTIAAWLPQGVGHDESSPSGVDPSVLSDLLGGDRAKIARFALKFIEVATTTVADMVSADERDDATTLLRLAHSIKSSAATVGAMHFSRTCQEIERATREDQVAERHELVATLVNLFDGVRRELESMALPS